MINRLPIQMKTKIIVFALSIIFIASAFAGEYTSNYRLYIPGWDEEDWQDDISRDLITIDSVIYILSEDVTRSNELVINVKEFGAVGDGSTDDTTAIQNAINTLSTDGVSGVVYFPEGTYKVIDTLKLHNFTTLEGAGHGVTITGDATKPVIGVFDSSTSCSKVQIKNIQVSNGTKNNAGGVCIDFRNVNNSRIDNVQCKNAETGLLLGSYNPSAVGCYYNQIYQYIASGTKTAMTVGLGANDTLVFGGKISSPQTGISVDAGNVSIIGTSIEGITDVGINLASNASRTLVMGTRLQGSVANAISVDSSASYNTFIGVYALINTKGINNNSLTTTEIDTYDGVADGNIWTHGTLSADGLYTVGISADNIGVEGKLSSDILSSDEMIIGSNSLYVDSSGNVGIGTNAPSVDFEVVDYGTNSITDIYATTYNDQVGSGYGSGIVCRKAYSDTLGTTTETPSGEYLGWLYFQGCDSANGFAYGVKVEAVQDGSAGAVYVPTDLIMSTYSNSAQNANQFVLDGPTGNLGAGTTSPITKLEVVGKVSADAYHFDSAQTSSPDTVSSGVLYVDQTTGDLRYYDPVQAEWKTVSLQ